MQYLSQRLRRRLGVNPRLSDTPTGARVLIERGNDPMIERRLIILGLIDGVEIEIESRGRRGDLIVKAAGDRFHITSHEAQRIRVQPILQGSFGYRGA